MRNPRTKPVLMGFWAVGSLLLSLLLPMQARSQEQEWRWPPCSADWFYGNLSWLPMHYYDTETANAFFLVPLEGLKSLLPPGVSALAVNAEHSPWRPLAGDLSAFGVLMVSFLHHQSVQYLEPYFEESVNVVVEDPSWDQGFFPVYVTSMTLNNQAAIPGGIQFWGFPKIFGDVHFQAVKPKGFKCFCSTEDGMILKLEVATDDAVVPTFPARLMFLTSKDGYLVRTPWEPTGGTEYFSLGQGKSTIHLGQHPIARQLRAMGVEKYFSIGQVWNEHVQSTLPRGMCEPLPAAGSK